VSNEIYAIALCSSGISGAKKIKITLPEMEEITSFLPKGSLLSNSLLSRTTWFLQA
jgi:hypothetical protein